MQKIALYLLGALIVALSAFAFYEHTVISDQARNISALEKTIAARDIFVTQTQQAAEKMEKQNKAFSDESAALRNKLSAKPTPGATPPPNPTPTPADTDKKAGLGGMMDKMMKDPKMLDAIAAQQMSVLKPMYADLVKQLKLSPEETKEFYDLLAEQTSKTMQAGMKMMSGDKKALDDLKGGSDDIKAFLGDRYSTYETYQQSVPDRAQVTQINSQMAARQTPLRPDQSAGLLQIMQREKLNTAKFSSATTNPQNTDFSEKTIDDTYNAVAERNSRILSQSKTLLTPEQWQALSEQQQQTLEMQKMGMEMAKGMFSK